MSYYKIFLANEIPLFKYEEEEEKDYENLKIFIDKQMKILKILFTRYTIGDSPAKKEEEKKSKIKFFILLFR